MEREHRGKKFTCKFCPKRLASKFSMHRHILSAHSNDVSDEENEEENTAEIVYDRVEEIVPPEQEDEMIRQQSENIQKLENELKEAKQQIKIYREQLKSMQSCKRN